MSQMSQVDTSEGNTSPRSRKWCFTIHNYTDDDVTDVTRKLEKNSWTYIFSEEKGKTGETPHLQGYLEGKNAIRFDTLKNLFPKAHLEKAKGNQLQNITYIKKEGGKCYTNITLPYEEVIDNIITNLRPWQQEIVDLLETKPNNRTIYWIYNKDGNIGKSALCKYLFINKKISWIRTAKTSDIKHILNTSKNARDIIIDLPRDTKKLSFSYSLLEELKDGLIFSGKYEGCCKLIATPHIIVMANFPPNEDKLTEDRIKLIEIK